MTEISPTTLVIFGATGDLFRKKLSVALFDLYRKGALPPVFKLVAFSRRAWGDVEFRNFFREILVAERHSVDARVLDDFLNKVFYTQGDLSDLSSYHKLGEILGRYDRESGVCMSKLFYLVTPPSYYESILENISFSGLAIPCAQNKEGEETGWTRILIEKPFGSDLKNAERIDQILGKLFTENQIFRIDHYLAKETIQNILTFRFANAIFEPVWNRKFIEKVEIKIFEKGVVGARGSFYDGLGALRDVGQNHMLQMAALVAMENPKIDNAESIRSARAKVLAKFGLLKGKEGLSIRGQYDGYLSEQGVSPNSQTETYFKVKLVLNNSRFRGVPFVLEGGKGLSESKVAVALHFKEAIDGFCPEGVCPSPGNVITFRIQPNENVSLLYWAKKPGIKFGLEQKELILENSGASKGADSLDAYERVLIDAIRGDQTLFTSTKEVIAEWKIVHQIIKNWKKNELVKYKVGTIPKN